jgi:hypothetical protein
MSDWESMVWTPVRRVLIHLARLPRIMRWFWPRSVAAVKLDKGIL